MRSRSAQSFWRRCESNARDYSADDIERIAGGFGHEMVEAFIAARCVLVAVGLPGRSSERLVLRADLSELYSCRQPCNRMVWVGA